MSISTSKSMNISGRRAIVAGLLAISTLYVATSANAASLGHQPGMTAGSGPSKQMPQVRTHGHQGGYAPPYYADPSEHVRHVHRYDPNWRPDVPVSATTGLKPH